MSAQHSPAPWEWTKENDEFTNLVWRHPDGGGGYVVSIEYETGNYGLSTWAWMDISEADARLIAAAPYMAALLKSALEFITDEADNRSHAGSEHSDYEREPRDLADQIAAVLGQAGVA